MNVRKIKTVPPSSIQRGSARHRWEHHVNREMSGPGGGYDLCSRCGRQKNRLDCPVAALDEVPGEILSALQRVTGRLVLLSRDGEAGLQPDVQFAYGPALREGALIVYCDTDGAGYTPAMIDAMARVFVEELEPLGVPLALSVPPPSSQPWTLAEPGGHIPEVE